ncbi:MAG TPA: ion transporter [Candidatus Limnocylindria bacterium]|nr:ion transporter [Candidatus Limnocylindria bacterium]
MRADETALRQERESLLEQIDSALGGVMVLLSAAWIALLVVEFAGGGLPRSLEVTVWVIWAIFVGDFLLEFTIAPVKTRYLRTHWLTVVSLVLPAFRILRLASALRVLRLGRVVRGVGLLRLLTSINRGLASLRATAARRGLGYVIGATALVMLVGSAGMASFEAATFADYGEALWWTAYTMTTGAPTAPVTGEGKVLGWLLSLFGLGVFGYLTATLASHFIERDRRTLPAVPEPRSSI